MDLPRMFEAMSDPAAYPYQVQAVELRQTHISAVFLAGPYPYKVKKPVSLGFLDFSTLEKRRHFCAEEVRLNRRLAPRVYVGVVPLVRTGKGLRFEGAGDVVDWAVKMQRLPDEATLQERLRRGEVSVELVEKLARRIASFHGQAEANERIALFGRFEVVARTVLEIFTQAASQVATTVSEAVFGRVKSLVEEALERLRPLIGARAATFSTASLSVGNHAITAVYGGDGHFAGDTSGAFGQKVNIAPLALTPRARTSAELQSLQWLLALDAADIDRYVSSALPA